MPTVLTLSKQFFIYFGKGIYKYSVGGGLMILGIDVGGTHTDAVMLGPEGIIKSIKVTTDKDNLLHCVFEALDGIIKDFSVEEIEKINLSTTLTTNAIVENKGERVGLFIIPGPGVRPESMLIGEENIILSGSIDHRGREVLALNKGEIKQGINKVKEKGIDRIAVVGKFSIRNNKHELMVEKMIKKYFPEVKDIVLGHRLSGSLNFPRRVATAYLSAKVRCLHQQFVETIKIALSSRGISAPVYLLKADGGTVELDNSPRNPVDTALSGPAASIMGAVSLNTDKGTAVVLDIGGTTTDLAILVDNVPLFQPKGAVVGEYKTLVRSLYTKSIGLGGDSVVTLSEGQLNIGPERLGPAACLGGPAPTLTDGFAILGLTDIGDRQLAVLAYNEIADQLGVGITQTANLVVERAKQIVIDYINKALEEFKDQPVYTIHELLEDFTLQPDRLIGIGGPAHLVIPSIATDLGWSAVVPEQATVANAVGSASARTTAIVSLRVDTGEGFIAIPEFGYRQKISSNKKMTMEDAMSLAIDWMRKKALEVGVPAGDLEIEITESQSFNVVNGFYTVGKIMNVTAQIKPGISSTVKLN